jgi:hypothetical protein
MLTTHRIGRLVENEQFSPLLDEVLSNGRPVALTIQIRLTDPQGCAASSLGFALARLSEITFAVSRQARQIVYRLASMQRADGAFGSIAATAVVVRGLMAVREQVGSEDLQTLIHNMVGSALSRFTLWQDEDGGFGDPIDTTICAWQLGALSGFRQAVRWGDFVEAASELTLPDDALAFSERAA